MEYEYEPDTFPYEGKTYNCRCRGCGGKDVFQLRRYTPDLKLKPKGFFVEIKGKFTASNRRLMEDFLRTGPKLDLRFIFQRDNWTTSKHTQRYTDWAAKHGCKSSVGEEVPNAWLQE